MTSYDSTSQTADFYAKIPVERHKCKKNTKKIGRGHYYQDKKAKAAEDEMTLRLKQMKTQLGKTIGGNLHCTFTFHFNDYYTKKGERRKTLPDLSNLIELPQDALEKAGIIENDTDIVSLDGSRRLPADENFIEILIQRVPHV